MPYGFINEFIKREKKWLKGGGKFILPYPNFKIFEIKIKNDKKKSLVLGCTGQDGSYMCELLLKKNYIVYGLLRKKCYR